MPRPLGPPVAKSARTRVRWNAAEHDPEWPFELLATQFELAGPSVALLVIDMHAKDLVMGAAVVYTRNGNVTSTGRELTRRLRVKGAADGERVPKQFKHPGQTPGHEIDSRIAPREEDLVVDKLTSGAFTASILDHALRNMGIKGLVIAGILTDMCVLGTARAAAELGYDSLICEDACATLTARAHHEALLMHARVFGRVAATEDVIAELTRGGP